MLRFLFHDIAMRVQEPPMLDTAFHIFLDYESHAHAESDMDIDAGRGRDIQQRRRHTERPLLRTAEACRHFSSPEAAKLNASISVTRDIGQAPAQIE